MTARILAALIVAKVRPFLLLAALLVTGTAQAQFDSNIPYIPAPKKYSRDVPTVLCAPPSTAVVGKMVRYQGYPMRIVEIVSDEAIAAANAAGVALAVVGAGHVTYCRGNTVRVRAVPVPGYPAPPKYEPDPSAANGSQDVLPEQREVGE